MNKVEEYRNLLNKSRKQLADEVGINPSYTYLIEKSMRRDEWYKRVSSDRYLTPKLSVVFWFIVKNTSDFFNIFGD